MPITKIKKLNSQDIFNVMQQILLRENKIRRNQKHLWVVGLNSANKILYIELLSLGANERLHIAPPEVFRIAIYKLAAKIVLVHNHIGGVNHISKAEKDFTDHMIKSGDLLKIEVLDHLMITEDSYTSFKDIGLMDELRKSGRYELIDKQEEKKQRMVAVATKLKKAGVDINTIQTVTLLKKSEISKLK